MKKKLLTLAVAAALPMATQAANAEVTIYGQIHASIDYLNADQDTITAAPAGSNSSLWDVTSRATRLGFKGSEDLGNGMKMIWKIETQMSLTDGGTFGFRNTYIGLSGDWGTFLYGRHDTPVKMSTGRLDIFGDTIADYNAGNQNGLNGGFVDVRANDAIAYVSPNFSGLTLVGAIVPDADAGEADADERGDFAGAYSIAAMYSNGGLFIGAGYENLDNLNSGADASHWRIGVGYDFGDFHIGGVYQDADGAIAGDRDPATAGNQFVDWKTYTINGSYKFGNNVVKAMWMRSDWDDDIAVYEDDGTPGADDKFDSWAIGLDHNFSKRSKVYVIYANSDMALHGSNFNRPGNTNLAREQSAFSLGMVHKF